MTDPKKQLEQFIENTRAMFGIELQAQTIEEAKRELEKHKSTIDDAQKKRIAISPPATIDEEARSVDCVIATENPVLRLNWRTWEYENEILLMDGCRLDDLKDGIPFIDSHRAYDGVNAVFGTTTNIRIEGDKLVGTRIFSAVPEADKVFRMIKEGHLKKQSVGYRIMKSVKVAPGETVKVLGIDRKNDGELSIRYVTDWIPVEDSIVIIPADPKAGVRSLEPNIPTPTTEDKPNNKRNEDMAKDNENKQNTVNSPADPVNVDEVRKAVLAEERARLQEIEDICSRHGIDGDLKQKFIAGTDGFDDIGKVRAAVLDAIEERSKKQVTPPAGKVTVEVDAMDKLIPVMRDGLMLGHGLISEKDASAGANEFRGLKPCAFAAEFLQRRGEKVKFSTTPQELFKRLMVTTDFPNLLSNTAETTAQKAFDRANETYEVWCDMSGTVSDLRAENIGRILGKIDLEEVKEGQESKYAYFTENADSVSISKYAKKVQFTEEMMINDKWGQFMKALDEFGLSARALEGDMAYGILCDNPDAADGTELFHADHKNLAGTAAVPTEASLNAAFVAMATQLDVDGKTPIRITPTFVIAPYYHSLAINKVLYSQTFADGNAAATQVNTMLNRLTPVYDSRLDAFYAALIEASSSNKYAWFVTGPKGTSVKFYFLNGQRRFALQRWEEPDRDALTIKLKHRVGVHIESYQGFYKNAGA